MSVIFVLSILHCRSSIITFSLKILPSPNSKGINVTTIQNYRTCLISLKDTLFVNSFLQIEKNKQIFLSPPHSLPPSINGFIHPSVHLSLPLSIYPYISPPSLHSSMARFIRFNFFCIFFNSCGFHFIVQIFLNFDHLFT